MSRWLEGIPIGLGLAYLLLWVVSCNIPPPSTACPPVTDIPAKTMTQAADELTAPPPKPALETIVADWIQTRDRLRLCNEEPK